MVYNQRAITKLFNTAMWSKMGSKFQNISIGFLFIEDITISLSSPVRL